MEKYFRNGTVIDLANGSELKIKEKLGEGGQGVVYRVEYNNMQYALKWYHPGIFKEPDSFYNNLRINIEKGAPTNNFLWPLYLTEKYDDSFGYLMKLRPSQYVEFSDFLLAKSHFASLQAVVNAAINITKGFRDLHRNGYSYQDLNDGNFFIDPKTGDVLICDNDNIAPDRTNLGIAGKARYMAPEVVRNISKPDYYSDRFSLAVILFRLLFLDHPLEGEIVASAPCITETLELKYYGKNPVFIFDTNDTSNRPVPSIHRNVIKLWNIYPQFIKDMFIKAFSKDAMNADDMDTVKQTRILDNEWLQAFIKLRSSIITCSCGEETFINVGEDSKCINCGRDIPKTLILNCQNGKYLLPILPGVKLYQCQIESDDLETVVGEITRHPSNPGIWGLKNDSKDIWYLKMADGSEKKLEPGKSAPIMKIDEISFNPNSKNAKIYK